MSRLNSFLRGVKVLDLSLFLPGPLASLLLADMGAEVLKIEPPAGDGMRELGPRTEAGAPIFYEAGTRKSVCRLDLKSDVGRRDLQRLAREADVLLEGFRPGVMARLGLDYDALKEINPGLVYCSISGFGVAGPCAQVAGHDANFLALAGVLFRNGELAPTYYDPPLADSGASLFAVISILGALQARSNHGRGCFIDLALADSMMPLQLFQVAAAGAIGTNPGPGETYLNGGAAYYQVYRTSDDNHMVLGAVEPKFWENFCRAAGHPEWITRQSEPMPQHSLIGEVSSFIAGLTLDECTARFGPADCCYSPVLDLAEALRSPHHRERGVVRRSEAGDLQTLFPALVDGEPPAVRARVRVVEKARWGAAASEQEPA